MALANTFFIEQEDQDKTERIVVDLGKLLEKLKLEIELRTKN
jgi:hypothetical protein